MPVSLSVMRAGINNTGFTYCTAAFFRSVRDSSYRLISKAMGHVIK